MIGVSVAMALFFGLSFAIPKFIDLRNYEIARLSEFRERFFKNAETLVDSEDFPDDMIQFLEIGAKMLGNARYSLVMLMAILRRRIYFDRHLQISTTSYIIRTEISAIFNQACTDAIIGSTYNIFLIGYILRKIIV